MAIGGRIIRKFIKAVSETVANTDNAGLKIQAPNATSFEVTLDAGTPTAARTVTLPDASVTVVGDTNTQTLTNKSIDADTNTITNIDNNEIKAGAAIALNKLAATTASKALQSDASGFVSASAVTNTELGYLSGVTSAIQTQINNRLNGTLTSGNIYVGDGSNIATAVAVTGDVTLSNTGNIQIASGAIVDNDINASAAISRSKIAAGTPTQVVINNGSGLLSSTSSLGISLGGTGATSQAAAFDALSPTSNKGDIIARTSATNVQLPVGTFGQVLTADDSQTTGLKWSSPATGTKNYIPNSNFESNTTNNWSLGTIGTLTNGLPTGSPNFGSGASGNLSISTVSSGKLAGSYSLQYQHVTNTTVAGNMVATSSIPIDLEDRAKVLTYKFYYSPTVNPSNANFSGTSSNSFAVAVYDDATGVFLPVAGAFAMTQGTGVGIATGTFQTLTTTASLRFIIYNANATTNNTGGGAITLLFDDITVGPQTAPIGAVATDWQSYTPTISTGTFTSNTGWWRRVGDTAEVVIQSGPLTANGSGLYTWTLPSGLVIDVSGSKQPTTTPSIVDTDAGNFTLSSPIGIASMNNQGSNWFSGGTSTSVGGDARVYAASTTTVAIVSNSSTTVSRADGIGSANSLAAVTPTFNIKFSVPIAGWSSNVQMSNDTDTRVVSLRAGSVSSSLTSSLTDTIFSNKIKDTHNAYNTSTGVYTIPVSGTYRIMSHILISGTFALNTTNEMDILKNGTVIDRVPIRSAATVSDMPMWIFGEYDFVAGDTLKIQSASAATTPAYVSSDTLCNLNIDRISGPSVVAATESVNCKATTSNTAIATTATTTVVYSAVEFDSHNAYSTSTGKYTCPVSGIYRITGAAYTGNTGALTISQESALIANQSGSVSKTIRVASWEAQNTTAQGCGPSGSTTFKCLAGDQLWFTFKNGTANTNTLDNSSDKNYINIERVGN